MLHATVSIDRRRTVGTIDPMIFGQYLEHVQPEDRCIYGAVMEEDSPHVDERGLRTDVIEAVRELGAPVVRWPGGCYADVYHWEDGIGPAQERPVRRNWHWGGIEPNRFGTHEFLDWCELVGTAPYVNVNFGTGTLNEALRWLDYCTGVEPTTDVQRRQANGRATPWNVPFWGLGNEQWGDWEAGHMSAPEYAARLKNWAQFFKKYDPNAHLIGIGSSAAKDPAWDTAVLHEAGHLIDYLTLHIYGHSFIDEPDDYHATVHFPVYVEERLERMAGAIRAAGHGPGSSHPIRISVDEWNIRHVTRDPDGDRPMLHRLSPRRLQDAIAAAGVFHAMARHAPVVGMANYVFLLNGNGVLLVHPEGLVKTPLYHLFQMYRRQLQPIVLDARVEAPAELSTVRLGRLEQDETRMVPQIDVIATIDEAASALVLGIVNRHRLDDAEIRIAGECLAGQGEATYSELTHEDARAVNDADHPDMLQPIIRTEPWTDTVRVKPQSVTLVRVPVSD